MQAEKVIRLAAAGAVLWYGLLRGVNALVMGVRGFRFSGISLTNRTATFVLDFQIHNPLFVGVTLNSVLGDVYIQGVKCGAVQNIYNYYLSGGKTHNIPVSVTIDLSGLASAVVANIESGNVQTLTIDFDGAVVVGSSGLVRLPIQKTITYNDLLK